MPHSLPLSKADSTVLAQVFDPESSPERPEITIDPSLPADSHISDPALLRSLQCREKEAIRLIEAFEKSSFARESAAAGDRAKDETYRAALGLLTQIVAEHPTYASARNNRAQLRRWRFGDRNLLCPSRRRSPSFLSAPEVDDSVHPASEGSATVEDLMTCISLSSTDAAQRTPAKRTAVSPTQGRILAQAYTQLGAVYHAAAKDLESSPSPLLGDGAVHSQDATVDASVFSEAASHYFYLGGLYGNQVAQALAVHANPHARLCGGIVREAMRKEMEGEMS